MRYLEKKYDGIKCGITKGMISLDQSGKVDWDNQPEYFEIRYRGVNSMRYMVPIEDTEDFEEKVFNYVNCSLHNAGFIIREDD